MAMKMKLNKEQLMDKIWGCWVGKNIGGTLGTPYEGKREIHDITGFASKRASRCLMMTLTCSLYGLKLCVL